MSRARDLSRLSSPTNFTVDASTNRVGLGSTDPTAKLNVAGIVSATSFFGDGSNLEGVASAGLGTALGENDPLAVVYYTDNVLNITDTTTITVPTGSDIAYTQYSEIAVADTKDLIVADGDDFVPDILGLSTEGITPLGGSGGRVRADFFTNHAGTGAPTFQNGINVTAGTASFSGNVTAGTASFSGNVSIAGTLTYEDVTNVDSVGVITARDGIRIGTGGTVGPVGSGIVTYFGDGSQLTGIDAAPSFSGIASGSLSNGSSAIICHDGKVMKVGLGTDNIFNISTPTIYESAQINEMGPVVYDSANNKSVFLFQDVPNSRYGTAVVGTLAVDGTFSYGTPAVFESGETNFISATYDPDEQKVVIVYTDGGDSDKGKAVVGTVNSSDNSIDFGNIVELAASDGSTNYRNFSATYDTNSNKVVIAFQDQLNNLGKAVVGTVTGTSISFGSIAQFNAHEVSETAITFDSSNNKVVIAYRDNGDSSHGYAVVGNVSGTSISFGSEVEFENADTNNIDATFDSNSGKVVIAYTDNGNSSYGTAIVGTVTGTAVTFGNPVVFESASTGAKGVTFDTLHNQVTIGYRDEGNSNYGTIVTGSVNTNNNSITFTTPEVFESNSTNRAKAAFDTDKNRSVITYLKSGSPDEAKAFSFSPVTDVTNLTDGNFLGFSNAAYTNGQTAKIQVVGAIDDAQTGLTTGAKHYVQKNGSLATTADAPSVEAGTALSATQILIR